jgi:hypothetical protein
MQRKASPTDTDKQLVDLTSCRRETPTFRHPCPRLKPCSYGGDLALNVGQRPGAGASYSDAIIIFGWSTAALQRRRLQRTISPISCQFFPKTLQREMTGDEDCRVMVRYARILGKLCPRRLQTVRLRHAIRLSFLSRYTLSSPPNMYSALFTFRVSFNQILLPASTMGTRPNA